MEMSFVDTEPECVGSGHVDEAAELVPTSDDERMIDNSCNVGIGEFRGGVDPMLCVDDVSVSDRVGRRSHYYGGSSADDDDDDDDDDRSGSDSHGSDDDDADCSVDSGSVCDSSCGVDAVRVGSSPGSRRHAAAVLEQQQAASAIRRERAGLQSDPIGCGGRLSGCLGLRGGGASGGVSAVQAVVPVRGSQMSAAALKKRLRRLKIPAHGTFAECQARFDSHCAVLAAPVSRRTGGAGQEIEVEVAESVAGAVCAASAGAASGSGDESALAAAGVAGIGGDSGADLLADSDDGEFDASLAAFRDDRARCDDENSLAGGGSAAASAGGSDSSGGGLCDDRSSSDNEDCVAGGGRVAGPPTPSLAAAGAGGGDSSCGGLAAGGGDVVCAAGSAAMANDSGSESDGDDLFNPKWADRDRRNRSIRSRLLSGTACSSDDNSEEGDSDDGLDSEEEAARARVQSEASRRFHQRSNAHNAQKHTSLLETLAAGSGGAGVPSSCWQLYFNEFGPDSRTAWSQHCGHAMRQEDILKDLCAAARACPAAFDGWDATSRGGSGSPEMRFYDWVGADCQRWGVVETVLAGAQKVRAVFEFEQFQELRRAQLGWREFGEKWANVMAPMMLFDKTAAKVLSRPVYTGASWVAAGCPAVTAVSPPRSVAVPQRCGVRRPRAGADDGGPHPAFSGGGASSQRRRRRRRRAHSGDCTGSEAGGAAEVVEAEEREDEDGNATAEGTDEEDEDEEDDGNHRSGTQAGGGSAERSRCAQTQPKSCLVARSPAQATHPVGLRSPGAGHVEDLDGGGVGVSQQRGVRRRRGGARGGVADPAFSGGGASAQRHSCRPRVHSAKGTDGREGEDEEEGGGGDVAGDDADEDGDGVPSLRKQSATHRVLYGSGSEQEGSGTEVCTHGTQVDGGAADAEEVDDEEDEDETAAEVGEGEDEEDGDGTAMDEDEDQEADKEAEAAQVSRARQFVCRAYGSVSTADDSLRGPGKERLKALQALQHVEKSDCSNVVYVFDQLVVWHQIDEEVRAKVHELGRRKQKDAWFDALQIDFDVQAQRAVPMRVLREHYVQSVLHHAKAVHPSGFARCPAACAIALWQQHQRRPRVRDRSGRVQVRSGRVQDRSSRDQSGRDQSSRVQDRPGRAAERAEAAAAEFADRASAMNPRDKHANGTFPVCRVCQPIGRRAEEISAGTQPVAYFNAMTMAQTAEELQAEGIHPDASDRRVACQYCGALHMRKTSAYANSSCCGKGSLRNLPPWLKPLDNGSAASVVYKLWRSGCRQGKLLREYARPLNNALALASSVEKNKMEKKNKPPSDGSDDDDGDGDDSGGGVTRSFDGYAPSVLVNGKLVTMIGPLRPSDDCVNDAGFAQLYVLGDDAATGDTHDAILDRRLGFVMRAMPKALREGKDAATVRKREELADGLRKLLATLTAALRQPGRLGNPWVQDFMTAAECLAAADRQGTPIDSVVAAILPDMAPVGAAPRTYNAAAATSEVMMCTPDDTLKYGSFVLRLRAKAGTKGLQELEPYNRAHDPTHFPLLFPCGRDGWFAGMKVATDRGIEIDVTPKAYYNYYSYERRRHPAHPQREWDDSLFYAGRLFQEYICSAWIKTEDRRLGQLNNATGQEKLRAELYQDLEDHLNSADAGVTVGRIVMPSSARGSARRLSEFFHSAMATIKQIGPPTLFITVTANPRAPEVEACLHSWQTAADRWDLCDEVFEAHFRNIVEELTRGHAADDPDHVKPKSKAEGGVFGTAVAHFNVLEFQKRGLPHRHLLLWLNRDEADVMSDDLDKAAKVIDTIISAQLPANPELKEQILKTNIHHCTADTCSKGGYCKNFYPKKERAQTYVSPPGEVDDFIQYARSASVTGQARDKEGKLIEVSAANVVPYSPYLTLRHLGSHINVEICATSTSPAYLTKYFTKGGAIDHGMVGLQAGGEPAAEGEDGAAVVENEIEQFQDRRIVSAHSALMALRSVSELELKPPVARLPVHLDGQRQVYIHVPKHAGDQLTEQQKALNKAAGLPSMLDAFFKANKAEPELVAYAGNDLLRQSIRTLPYEKVPRFFTWEDAAWKPRVKVGPTKLGRVRWIHPRDVDLFFLRRILLSNHAIGKTSFKDLLTVGGREYPTVCKAAGALGFTNGCVEYHECIVEAAESRSPARVRDLFVSICAECRAEISDPRELYESVREYMVKDWRDVPARDRTQPWVQQLSGDEKESALDALLAAELLRLAHKHDPLLSKLPGRLGLSDKSVADIDWAVKLARDACGRPFLPADTHASGVDVSAARARVEVRRRVRPLSDEQGKFVDAVKAAVTAGEGGLFFLSAGAGTGKTDTLNFLIDDLRGDGVDVRAMASSGIAAQLLSQPASTVHAATAMPLLVAEEPEHERRLQVQGAKKGVPKRRSLWKAQVFGACALTDSLMCVCSLSVCLFVLADVWLHCGVAVWDEACMSNVAMVDALKRSLHEMAMPRDQGGLNDNGLLHQRMTPHDPASPSPPVKHEADVLFAKKVVVCAGHWAQMLPIVSRGDRALTTSACLFQRPYWQQAVQTFSLTKNFRLLGADEATREFSVFLDGIADGSGMSADSTELGPLPSGGGVVELPEQLILRPGPTLPTWVYEGARAQINGVWDRARPAGAVGHGVRAQALDGSLIGRAYYDWWTQRAVLAPHRKTVAAINDEVVKLFARRMTCLSEDVVNDADDSGRHHGTGVGPDTLALNWPPGAAPHELSLAPGMPIMCLMNFGGIGVMNGTRMIITELKCHSDGRVLFLSCCFYDVSGRLRQVDIPRVPVQVTKSDMPFVWTRKQFPVMLCFAMTINKSQGQTLPARVGVVATSHVFAHGQLYVALGRVTHPDNLRVWTLCDKEFVRNVVYVDIVAKGVARVD